MNPVRPGGAIEPPNTTDRSDGRSGGAAIFAPYGEDANLVGRALRDAGISSTACASAEELRQRTREGADLMLVSQEALTDHTLEVLTEISNEEPVWSELPLVLLVDARFAWEAPGRNATLLRRPVAADGLVSVVRLARESRARQYTIRNLLAELAEVNTGLETRVEERTAELQSYTVRLEREIAERRAAQEALRRARARLAERQEEDRRRLGRDLHDDVVQRLLALNMDLARKPAPEGGAALAPRLESYRREVLAIADAVRGLIRQLHPVGLDLGIAEALDAFVRDVRQRAGGSPDIVLRIDLLEQPTREAALCLYRSAQELVRNSVRHAGADRVEVRLEGRGERVRLTVADDGAGFEPPATLSLLGMDEHFGLLGVEEHAGALAGSLEVRSAPGEGTTAVVEVPVHPPGGEAGTRP